ncbi:Reverse transcriptase domain-containing protein [Plasmodiophora brassicae]
MPWRTDGRLPAKLVQLVQLVAKLVQLVAKLTQSVRKFAAKLGWCPASMLGGRRRGLAWCCAVVLDDVNVVEPRPVRTEYRFLVASELIDKYRRLKQPVTTILLDNQKAYDTTERALANEKLLARGVPAHVNVAVVQSQFDGCTFQMMLDRQLSSAIDVLVGVFQRAMLSLLLFNIHIDDLPVGLCRVFGRVAPSLYGQPISAQMFADDTSLYALSDDVAQRMLDHREDYDRRHWFVFNARKPQVTKDPARRGATFTTMGDEIPDEADLASSTKLPSSWEW